MTLTILQLWIISASVIAIILAYALERYSIEIVSVAAIAFYLVFFQLLPVEGVVFGPTQILAGFANPALITILALLVVGQGIFQTGAMESPSRFLARMHDKNPIATILALFLFVMTISAFINNTPVVIMFIPVLVSIAAKTGTSASAVMIPLSYVSILAGMVTLIGSSTNLLVADVLVQTTDFSLGFFTQTPLGLVLAAVGLVYLATIGRKLTPERVPAEDDNGTGRQYVAQIEITPGHAHEGDEPVAGMFPRLNTMTVSMVRRGDKTFLPPFADEAKLQAGDILTIAATRTALYDLLKSDASLLSSMLRTGGDNSNGDPAGELALTEAVVAPHGRYVGQSLASTGFRSRTGCIVLGIERKAKMVRRPLSSIRLQGGDDLLIFGARKDLHELRHDRDLLVLLWSMSEVPDIRRAAIARVIFAAIVLLAVTGILPILHAALAGAIAMIASKCLNLRQAVRALDLRIFLLIGAAFAMGGSLQAVGGADLIAQTAVAIALPFGVMGLLIGLFGVVALLTNIMSNAATAVLFAPIAVRATEAFANSPEEQAKLAVAAVLTVIYAANCSFATPIAYQTNLLVMGPGHYKFLDYVRVGAPLILLLWLTFAIAAPFLLRL